MVILTGPRSILDDKTNRDHKTEDRLARIRDELQDERRELEDQRIRSIVCKELSKLIRVERIILLVALAAVSGLAFVLVAHLFL